MSNLNSVFDVLRGYPNDSALGWDFKQHSAASPNLAAGAIVGVVNDSGVAGVNRLTSGYIGTNLDSPWLVFRGKDQTDAQTAGRVTCLRLRTGLIFRVPTAETPTPGDLLWANAGVLTKTDPGGETPTPHLGKVLEYNSTEHWMLVES